MKYERGTVMFIDYVKSKYFNRYRFEAFVHVCGNCGPLEFYFKLHKDSIGNTLRRLSSELDVREMLKNFNGIGC